MLVTQRRGIALGARNAGKACCNGKGINIIVVAIIIIITTIITNITIIITSPASLLLNCWWLSSVVPSWTKWPPGSKPLPVENKFQISFKITLIPIHTIHGCVFVFTDDQSNVSSSLAIYTYCHFTPVSLEFSETRDVSIVPRLCKTKFDLETCESSTVAKNQIFSNTGLYFLVPPTSCCYWHFHWLRQISQEFFSHAICCCSKGIQELKCQGQFGINAQTQWSMQQLNLIGHFIQLISSN